MFGILAIPFITAAPADILRNGDAGRESPVHTGGADFFGSDARGFFDEVGIAGAAEADVLREASGADDVVVAVDGVNAIDERDFQARVCGARLIFVIHVRPGDEIVAGFRDRNRRR